VKENLSMATDFSLARIIGTGVFCVLLGCARSTACDPATVACGPEAESVVRVDEDVVLIPGRIVRIEDSQVQLSFERVVSDSRCPRDVVCVWAGNAAARIRVWSDTATARTIDVNSTVEPKSARIDGYVLRLVAVAPDPVSTTRIEPTAYRLTIRIERS
jgi:hypothetical protein